MNRTEGFLLKLLYAIIINTGYFALAFIVSNLIDSKIFGRFDEQKAEKKNTIRLIGEALLHTALLVVYIYITNEIIKDIEYPIMIDGEMDYIRYSDIIIPQFYIPIILAYQHNLLARLNLIRKRIF